MFLTPFLIIISIVLLSAPPPPGYFLLSLSLTHCRKIMSFFMHWAYTCLQNFRAVSIFCTPLINVVPLNTRVLVFYMSSSTCFSTLCLLVQFLEQKYDYGKVRSYLVGPHPWPALIQTRRHFYATYHSINIDLQNEEWIRKTLPFQ
jgi:hypothetical protein